MRKKKEIPILFDVKEGRVFNEYQRELNEYQREVNEHDVFDENFRLETYKQMKRREFRNWIKSFMKK